MTWITDKSPGARAVSVPCLRCGRMLRLADAAIDTEGPAFRAYYHPECARQVAALLDLEPPGDI